PVQFEGNYYHIARSTTDPKPIQPGGIPIIMGAATLSAIKRAARIADGLTPVASSFEALEGVVTTFRSAAREAGRDPSTLKIYVRVNGTITTNPLPQDGRPFLSGSPDQIAGDLDNIGPLNIDHVFFSEHSTSNLDAYLESLGRLQSIVRASQ